LFDCGQGVTWCGCRSVLRVLCNFAQFNRIVGAARRLNAAIGAEY
jgi:hypothetical protein